MEKIAFVELNINEVKLSFVQVSKNRAFNVYREVNMPVYSLKDFAQDNIIKPAAIKELLGVLAVYKQMILREQVETIKAIASGMFRKAKNFNGFIDEVQNAIANKVEVLDSVETMKQIYTAVINTMNKPKGVIINIDDDNIQLQMYNRRNVLDCITINNGLETLDVEYNEQGLIAEAKYNKIKGYISEELKKNTEILSNIPEDYEFVGCGEFVKALGTVCMRACKYPLNQLHGFEIKKSDFEKIASHMKGVDNTKASKIKGISVSDSKYLPVGVAVLDAIFEVTERERIFVCVTDEREGVLFNYTIPLTEEKPITDTLGYSLQAINEFYDVLPNNASKVYELSLILVKQLKVLHKLGRLYVKVLRIASYLYDSGNRVNVNNSEKNAFEVILNSNIYGATHSEIVMGAFVASVVDPDNFNLADYVKFKDLLTEEDLVAIKKLAIILKLAIALDITGFGNVTDISCDILGDSVIMKTVVENPCPLEIKTAMLCQNEFKKAFGKNLEVL